MINSKNLLVSARTIFFAVLIGLAAASFSCSVPGSNEDEILKTGNLPKIEDPDLEKALTLWKSKNIKNYDMIVHAEMPDLNIYVKNVKIRVREDRKTLVLSADQSETGTLSGWDKLETIDMYFDGIQVGRNRGTNNEMEIEYDSEFGYPKKMVPKNGGLFEIRKFRVATKDEEWQEPAAVNPELEMNRQKWQQTGLRNYNMVAEITAGGVSGDRAPVQIMVFENGGPIISWKDPRLEGDDKTGEMKQKYLDYASVEKLFSLIRDNHAKEGVTLKVNYHKTMGYPVSIEIRRQVVDGYFIFRVKEIVPRANID